MSTPDFAELNEFAAQGVSTSFEKAQKSNFNCVITSHL